MLKELFCCYIKSLLLLLTLRGVELTLALSSDYSLPNVNIGTVPGVEKFTGQLPVETMTNKARNYIIK